MKNVTLSLNEDVLVAGRSYAKKRNISFNTMIRCLLERTVVKFSPFWVDESFKLMDKAKANSALITNLNSRTGMKMEKSLTGT